MRLKEIAICICLWGGVVRAMEWDPSRTEKEFSPAQREKASRDLIYAMMHHRVKDIKQAVEKGANLDVDQVKMNPLVFAIASNNYELVEFLLKHGANLDAKLQGNIPTVREYAKIHARASGSNEMLCFLGIGGSLIAD